MAVFTVRLLIGIFIVLCIILVLDNKWSKKQ